MIGYVYLIGSSTFGWYKIGKSRSPNVRIKDLGVLLPFKIEVFAVWAANNHHRLEALLHEQYEQWQINGEWFRLDTKQIEELINSVPAGNLIPFAATKFNNVKSDAPEGREIKIRYTDNLSKQERERRRQSAIAERLQRQSCTPRCPSCGQFIRDRVTHKVPVEASETTRPDSPKVAPSEPLIPS